MAEYRILAKFGHVRPFITGRHFEQHIRVMTGQFLSEHVAVKQIEGKL